MSNDHSRSKPTLAFIGLGHMGFPMAGHLATAGYPVIVYNRTADRAREWAHRYCGKIADTPAEAARDADIVLVCVSRDQDVSEVVLGASGVLSELPAGRIIVDHSTGSASFTRELAEAVAIRGCFVLDAPVAGGEPAAIQGNLSIMIGGDEVIAKQCEPVLRTYAKSVVHMGGNGCGQLMKMANQVCVAGVAQGLAESLALAKRSGLDAHKALEVLAGGAGRSFWMDYRGRATVEGRFEPGFSADLMRKDLGIVLQQAEAVGLSLSNTRIFDEALKILQSMNRGDDDISAVFEIVLADRTLRCESEK
jgi:3-hydroxyisobutyrate dehydrogenase